MYLSQPAFEALVEQAVDGLPDWVHAHLDNVVILVQPEAGAEERRVSGTGPGYDLLGLVTYFTIGPKEAHALTITAGTKAPQAAGTIHTDFERGFIAAETVACADFIALGGEAAAKEAGKMRLEGREYVVQDGDIMNFRFNV